MDIIIEKEELIEIYHSRIEDMTESNLVLAMPMEKGVPIFLLPHDIFYAKIIFDSCVYKIKMEYIDKKFKPIPVWMTSVPTEVEKIQQREFVRVEAFIDCRLEILDKEQEMKPILEMKAITRDISGGGVQITTYEPIDIGTIVNLSFPISNGIINSTCEVIRASYQADHKVYWLGLKYLAINEADRNKLIRHIFQLQIEKKRRK